MSDFSSVMDKIRILRSNRRKPKFVKTVDKEATVTLAPVTSTAGIFTSSQQQWVPFVVLDIGQSQDNSLTVENTLQPKNVSLDTLMPISTKSKEEGNISLVTSPHASSGLISQTVRAVKTTTSEAAVNPSRPSRRSASPRKKEGNSDTCTITIVKKSPRKVQSRPKAKHNSEVPSSLSQSNTAVQNIIFVPNQSTTSSSSSVLLNAIVPISKQDAEVSLKLPIYAHNNTVTTKIPVLAQNTLVFTNTSPRMQSTLPPEPPPDVTVSLTDSEPNLRSDNTTTILAPICCVICNRPFPTLADMQYHYLSEHKNRRGCYNKKRNLDTLISESQVIPKLTPIQPMPSLGESSDESELNIYVDKSDPKCPVCSISFKTIPEVKEHVKLVHSYKCSECNCTFYTLFEFTCHKCNKGGKKARAIRKKASPGNSSKTLTPLHPKGNYSPSGKKISRASKKKAAVNDSPDKLPNQVSGKDILPAKQKTTQEVMPTLIREKRLSQVSLPQETSHSLPPLLSRIEEPYPAPVTIMNAVNHLNGSVSNLAQETPGSYETAVPPSEDNSMHLQSPSENSKQNAKNIRILETKNLQCFKFKKENVVCKPETIQEKLAQLQKNPHVSVSWIPKLRVKNEDDGDFVCGRCNVLCDDMEDYMDHIQDCLNITSVTLEPTSKPPQRILKLQKEVSSFGFQEANNNRYTINKNLMNKLQSVFPEIIGLGDSGPLKQSPQKINTPSSSEVSSELCQTHQKDVRNSDSDSKSHEKTDFESTLLNVKEEPIDDYMQDDEVSNPRHPYENGKLTLNNNLKALATSKGMQPMVMIPVATKSEEEFFFKANKLTEHTALEAKDPSPLPTVGSPNSASWDSSSLDLLIDTDDIKMEVEEELIEDHFEDHL